MTHIHDVVLVVLGMMLGYVLAIILGLVIQYRKQKFDKERAAILDRHDKRILASRLDVEKLTPLDEFSIALDVMRANELVEHDSQLWN